MRLTQNSNHQSIKIVLSKLVGRASLAPTIPNECGTFFPTLSRAHSQAISLLEHLLFDLKSLAQPPGKVECGWVPEIKMLT